MSGSTRKFVVRYEAKAGTDAEAAYLVDLTVGETVRGEPAAVVTRVSADRTEAMVFDTDYEAILVALAVRTIDDEHEAARICAQGGCIQVKRRPGGMFGDPA